MATNPIRINYHGKRFRPLSNSDNGEVDQETIFEYKQSGNVLSCDYSGNQIVKGHLIGLVSEDGAIDMRYHQVNARGELMTGTCRSTPEIIEDGRIKLHEAWQWTSGDGSKGTSMLIEMEPED